MKEKSFRISAVRLRRGDIVVLKTDSVLSEEELRAVRKRVKKSFRKYEVVVLTAGVDIGVLRT